MKHSRGMNNEERRKRCSKKMQDWIANENQLLLCNAIPVLFILCCFSILCSALFIRHDREADCISQINTFPMKKITRKQRKTRPEEKMYTEKESACNANVRISCIIGSILSTSLLILILAEVTEECLLFWAADYYFCVSLLYPKAIFPARADLAVDSKPFSLRFTILADIFVFGLRDSRCISVIPKNQAWSPDSFSSQVRVDGVSLMLYLFFVSSLGFAWDVIYCPASTCIVHVVLCSKAVSISCFVFCTSVHVTRDLDKEQNKEDITRRRRWCKMLFALFLRVSKSHSFSQSCFLSFHFPVPSPVSFHSLSCVCLVFLFLITHFSRCCFSQSMERQTRSIFIRYFFYIL